VKCPQMARFLTMVASVTTDGAGHGKVLSFPDDALQKRDHIEAIGDWDFSNSISSDGAVSDAGYAISADFMSPSVLFSASDLTIAAAAGAAADAVAGGLAGGEVSPDGVVSGNGGAGGAASVFTVGAGHGKISSLSDCTGVTIEGGVIEGDGVSTVERTGNAKNANGAASDKGGTRTGENTFSSGCTDVGVTAGVAILDGIGIDTFSFFFVGADKDAGCAGSAGFASPPISLVSLGLTARATTAADTVAGVSVRTGIFSDVAVSVSGVGIFSEWIPQSGSSLFCDKPFKL
jgi:hypothetical protein